MLQEKPAKEELRRFNFCNEGLSLQNQMEL